MDKAKDQELIESVADAARDMCAEFATSGKVEEKLFRLAEALASASMDLTTQTALFLTFLKTGENYTAKDNPAATTRTSLLGLAGMRIVLIELMDEIEQKYNPQH